MEELHPMAPTKMFAVKLKSDLKSSEYRERGNELYKKQQIHDAIIFFNMALNFAKSKENLALAYANRSAAYLEANKYKECIDNIKLARKNKYPAEKMAKLDEREEKCLKSMMENLQVDPEESIDLFKLSYPANEKIPWIIDGLVMRKTKKYGRGIYTTRNLMPGDIVCVEELSITYFMQEEGCFKHCGNCFKTNFFNFIPCTKFGKKFNNL